VDETMEALAAEGIDGRIWLDVGGREDPEEPKRNARYVEDFERIASILRRKGYGDPQLRTLYVPDAPHYETAWGVRLPDALRFLLPIAG
jgi:hypothetical protein